MARHPNEIALVCYVPREGRFATTLEAMALMTAQDYTSAHNDALQEQVKRQRAELLTPSVPRDAE